MHGCRTDIGTGALNHHSMVFSSSPRIYRILLSCVSHDSQISVHTSDLDLRISESAKDILPTVPGRQ